jgi:hypothetical protein
MINLILFGFNIILIIVIWKVILRSSILGHFRDKLFDQREKIREYYIANKIPLEDETYKNIRDLINGHLRFTEDMSFTQVIHFASKIESDDDLKSYLKNQTDAKFKSDNQDLSKFLEESRTKSSRILFNYMILSSPALIMLLFCVSLFYVPFLILSAITKKISVKLNVFKAAYKQTALIISKFIKDDDLEELSYKRTITLVN